MREAGSKKNGVVLFIDFHPEQRKYFHELDGIRRYARPLGWEVTTLGHDQSLVRPLKALLARDRPAGCIVECSAHDHAIPPRTFGGIPVVYLDPQQKLKWRGALTVKCDNAAVARMAFRELSTGLPPSYAVVEYRCPAPWSRERLSFFRKCCRAIGKSCLDFPAIIGEKDRKRFQRLVAWVAALPSNCAVFAVNDSTAQEVRRAFATASRSVPHTAWLVGADAYADLQGKECNKDVSSVKIDFELAGFMAAKALGNAMATKNHRGLSNTDPFIIEKEGGAVFGPILVERRKSTQGRGRHEPFALEAVAVIRQKACDGLTPSALAKCFKCSRRLFDLRFREAVGHSVQDEIERVRLESVLEYLRDPGVPIGVIADFCGWRTPIALHYVFRRRMGMSMLAWRRRNCR